MLTFVVPFYLMVIIQRISMMKPIIAPVDKEILKRELTKDLFLRPTNKAHNDIYVVTAHNAPNVMREIGRLREISFRSGGGGTGEEIDTDEYDYMEKPFHLQELEARIRSLTRRKFVQKDVCLESGEIKFDTVRREAYAKGEMVSLTRKENGILEYLLLNMGRPVSQEELMEHVWDASVDSFSGAIRVHMSSLRRKLKAVLGYDAIMNKVGEGYKIREESD